MCFPELFVFTYSSKHKPKNRCSAVSWAVCSGDRRVNTIDCWPDPLRRFQGSCGVPSAVTYEKTRPHQLCQWGFPAIQQQNHLKNESKPFKLFKLLFENPRNVPDSDSDGNSELATLKRLLVKYGKTADDITADYLQCIWTFTKEVLNRNVRTFAREFALRVILTIPAVWTPITTERFKELAIRAGLPVDIVLLPESEAAAADAFSGTSQRARFKVGDVITICDAGGQTCVRFSIHGRREIRR